ncbi:hypothetical protein BBR47_41500 [Brevibacillus brevis NBRC 100599]|uniref:Uncharacterized protein n=1 Tax=Brevibacillus brevis (strain 47 / JCM 6285 / NBRC 100599) TaxID=358681 RepID=C0ZHK3_BREBN|nr:hypothetical protein BBR47_41500 [Brevibacillus brevis NBRC 100599]
MFSMIPSHHADSIEKYRYRIDFLPHKKYVKSIEDVTSFTQFSLTKKKTLLSVLQEERLT